MAFSADISGTWKHAQNPAWIEIRLEEGSGTVVRNDNFPDRVGRKILNNLQADKSEQGLWHGLDLRREAGRVQERGSFSTRGRPDAHQGEGRFSEPYRGVGARGYNTVKTMSYIAPYSPREEFANALTHGIGFLVAVAALVHMINVAPLELSVRQKAGVVVYGISVVLIIVWSMAVGGVVFKAFFAGRFKWISVGTYLFMGWLSVVVIYQLYQALPAAGFSLLLAGGLAYSVGVIFYVSKKIPFNHAIWHCFVFIGAASHCWLIAGHVLKGGRISVAEPFSQGCRKIVRPTHI